ncbi:MAG: hypothetical protein WBG37_08430 [Desulfobacterales bacterium]
MSGRFSTHARIACAFLAAAILAGCTPENPNPSESEAPRSLSDPTYYAEPVPGRCCTIIAHAGGAIDGNAYTNSIEAIERNYQLGTRIFEVDFDQTSDGHWVAVHHWPNWKKRTGYGGSLPPDLETFKSTRRVHKGEIWSIPSEYNSVTFPWLEAFLEARPDVSIVTDLKELDNFQRFVDAILASPSKAQFIFQAYSMRQIDSIKKQDPSARIILTLYRLGRPAGLYKELAARKERLYGVTVPMNWAFDAATLKGLLRSGVPIFLHGGPSNINSRALHSDFAAKGVSGFYLD